MSTKDLSRWSGIVCILAGLLIALITLVHPSRETPEIILKQELRLVTAHWLSTFFCGFLLLGLPGLYAAQSERAGRFGLVSFLMLFFGICPDCWATPAGSFPSPSYSWASWHISTVWTVRHDVAIQ